MTDPDRLVLVATDPELDALLLLGKASVVHESHGVRIVQCSNDSPRAPWRLGNSGWVKMFEHTFMRPEDVKLHRDIVPEFFDWLGDGYAHEIDHARNAACYDLLFEMAQQHRRKAPCAAVLDLGCGPATILESSIPRRARHIVGYDIAPTMRDAAEAAGLAVLNECQFRQAASTFDVVLSCYAMHYACELAETAKAVAAQLSQGGVWVMNFHKGLNHAALLDALLGAALRQVAVEEHSLCGTIVLVAADG